MVRFEPGRDDLSAVASAKEEGRTYRTIWAKFHLGLVAAFGCGYAALGAMQTSD